MTVRRLVNLLLLLALLAGLAWAGRALWMQARFNYARHLANNEQWSRLDDYLSRMDTQSLSSAEWREMAAMAKANLGDFHGAATALGASPGSPRGHLLAGLVHYEQGDEAAALASFKQALAGGEDNAGTDLARFAAGMLQPRGQQDAAPCDPSRMPGVGARVAHSLAGRSLFARGLYGPAGEHLRAALRAGDTNTSTRVAAAAAAAACADFAGALRLADYSFLGARFHHAVLDMIRRPDDRPVPVVSFDEMRREMERRRALVLAEAWALHRLAVEEKAVEHAELALALLDTVTTGAGETPGTSLLRIDILEQCGRAREAYNVCRGLAERVPGTALAMRMLGLASQSVEPELQALERRQEETSALLVIRADIMETTLPRGKSPGVCMGTGGTLKCRAALPAAGAYSLTVVARGDRAFGISPLLRMSVDGQPAAEYYLAGEAWGCRSAELALSAGEHAIQLEYANDSDRLLSNDEDRNACVLALIISRRDGR